MHAQTVIESSYRREIESAGASKGKFKEDKAPKLRALRRALAGSRGLMVWSELDSDDLAEGPGLELAKASMAMIEDPEHRQVAMLDLADIALRGDKVAIWRFCMDQGFDAKGSGYIEQSRGGFWALSDRAPMSWMAKAMRHESWKMVEALAACPEGKVGVPGFGADGLPVGDNVAKMEAAWKRMKLDPNQEIGALATWWVEADPILMCWQAGLDGVKIPASARKALAAGGFAPRFGHLEFDAAAACLALAGSTEAIDACTAAGVGPKAALDRGLLLAGEMLAFHAESGSSARDSKTWQKVKQWFDAHEGEGAAGALVESGAFAVLEQQAEDGWGRAGWGRAKDAPKALEWIASQGPFDMEKAKERLNSLQGWSIEIAELVSSGDTENADKLLSAVKKGMDIWTAKLGVGSPKRILKA